MSDPFDRAVSKAPDTVGEGCLSRYDIDQLSPEDGADFSAAQALLKQTQNIDQEDERDDPRQEPHDQPHN
ncbi:hypothetical protein [Pseudomonas segetis]|uniref:Uncharacterized protein n=1 Tax=Pseudomonas segetis TaxID=298908 RepID=A0A239CLU3_9PSED|nr:hypothetical protein [Pseudomonas segetis]SNS20474.1 hypothetical protein SAMN05216255_1756 [Pseudomonas segetis]